MKKFTIIRRFFEPLSDNVKNPMPKKPSLLEYCPPRKNQGQQISCIGWIVGTAYRPALFAKVTGEKTRGVTFGSSFVCRVNGIKILSRFLLTIGYGINVWYRSIPFSDFVYNIHECCKQPIK